MMQIAAVRDTMYCSFQVSSARKHLRNKVVVPCHRITRSVPHHSVDLLTLVFSVIFVFVLFHAKWSVPGACLRSCLLLTVGNLRIVSARLGFVGIIAGSMCMEDILAALVAGTLAGQNQSNVQTWNRYEVQKCYIFGCGGVFGVTATFKSDKELLNLMCDR